MIPTGFGEIVDVRDLSKAKYINPSKRRKMSYNDFERKVEEGNLILLDLLLMCKQDITAREYLEN